MSAADRSTLEQRLAKILGINVDDDRDYVIDVLNSLVDIGDPDDVTEYLSSFIASADDGGGGDDLRRFAEDVGRFKLGKGMSSVSEDAEEGGSALNAVATVESRPKTKLLDEGAARREEIKRREAEARERQREERDRLIRKKEEEEQRRRREEAVRAAATAKKKKGKRQEAQGGKKPGASQQERKANNIQSSALKSASDAERSDQTGELRSHPSSGKTTIAEKKDPETKQEPKRQQSKPKIGKPKRPPCGCFGTLNKPVANCLNCGRISCEAEGVDDYCHFCGHFIEGFASYVERKLIDGGTVDAKMDSAMRHKERLLRFDREFTQRTQIHDDQEDYFVTSTSIWATEQEQDEAREMEEDRRKKLHQRQRQVLKINF